MTRSTPAGKRLSTSEIFRYDKNVKTIFPSNNRSVICLLKFLGLLCAVTLLSGGLTASSVPQVSVTVSPSMINRVRLDSAQFTLSLSAPAPHDTGVAFFMSGTAHLNRDYVLSGNFNTSGQIVIPAGQTSSVVTLHTLFVDPSPVSSSATMNLLHDNTPYVFSGPKSATVLLLHH